MNKFPSTMNAKAPSFQPKDAMSSASSSASSSPRLVTMDIVNSQSRHGSPFHRDVSSAVLEGGHVPSTVLTSGGSSPPPKRSFLKAHSNSDNFKFERRTYEDYSPKFTSPYSPAPHVPSLHQPSYIHNHPAMEHIMIPHKQRLHPQPTPSSPNRISINISPSTPTRSLPLNSNYSSVSAIQMPRQVVILRGLPGTGKSQYARSLGYDLSSPTPEDPRRAIRVEPVICCVDDFFVDDNGVYRFERDRLGEAHRKCRSEFTNTLLAGEPLIVVDNTNCQRWEYQPYVDLADAYGYDLRIVEFAIRPEDVWRAHARNSHGVPGPVVRNMLKRWEPDTRATFVDTVFEESSSQPTVSSPSYSSDSYSRHSLQHQQQQPQTPPYVNHQYHPMSPPADVGLFYPPHQTGYDVSSPRTDGVSPMAYGHAQVFHHHQQPQQQPFSAASPVTTHSMLPSFPSGLAVH